MASPLQSAVAAFSWNDNVLGQVGDREGDLHELQLFAPKLGMECEWVLRAERDVAELWGLDQG
jgi:hypothetical protein